MKPPHLKKGQAADEAARWFARMNSPEISNAALTEFWEWRRSPENDLAYCRIEALWRSSAQLSGDLEIQSALAGARRRNRPPWLWLRRAMLPASGVILACCVSVAVILLPVGGGQTYSTKLGEERAINLTDGSLVRLDTNSAMTVHFTRNAREITLNKGQAFFDVVHSPERPLSVRVGQTLIRDLGTRFDVRRDGSAVRVILVEGAVEVGTTTRPAALSMQPGQEVEIGSAVSVPSPVDVAKATSWTRGQVIFDDMPLESAANEMNRYGKHKVVLESASAGTIRVSGAFNATDTAAFVAAVTRLYNLRAATQPDGSILLVGAGGERPF